MKKGKLEEIFSYAIFKDDLSKYSIVYRDLNNLKTISLAKWIKLSKNENIPDHRIFQVLKKNEIIFERIKR